jgi:hypothetical protein
MCKELGIEANYTYIAGLDSLVASHRLCIDTCNLISSFPIIQVFQPHNKAMKELMHPEAEHLDYFIETRNIYEAAYIDFHHSPNSWENYRSLWYFDFNGNKKTENRI